MLAQKAGEIREYLHVNADVNWHCTGGRGCRRALGIAPSLTRIPVANKKSVVYRTGYTTDSFFFSNPFILSPCGRFAVGEMTIQALPNAVLRVESPAVNLPRDRLQTERIPMRFSVWAAPQPRCRGRPVSFRPIKYRGGLPVRGAV